MIVVSRATPFMPRLPGLVVIGSRREPEAGHEVVGDDDVAQGVELVDAPFRRDRGTRSGLPTSCFRMRTSR